jgi:hypothetical protein
MRIKYVGCFESVIVGGVCVKKGETVELPDAVASGVIKNPGQWETVEDAPKASGKGVK